MSKVLAIIAVVALLLIGAVFWAISQPDDNLDSTDDFTTSQTNPETSSNESLPTYTTAEVAQHNTETDCWTIIDGDVYNLTGFIPNHPGGSNILSACGKDATEFFHGNQTGQAGGRNDHREDPTALNQLSRLKIGTLAQTQ